jgi:hypothetical protein
MQYFAGLDVSMEKTHVCVVTPNGTVVYEAKVPSTPASIAAALFWAISALNAAVTPGATFAWVGEEQADRAESRRQAHLEQHARRNNAFLLQLAEHEMRADRVFRVTEPPARVAEAHLRNAGPDAELELVVRAQLERNAGTQLLPAFDGRFRRQLCKSAGRLGVPVRQRREYGCINRPAPQH